MPWQIGDRLEGRRLAIAKIAFQPSSRHNSKAWAAIQPMLLAAGTSGVRYEQLAQAAKIAARSVGTGFISYLVRMGVLEIVWSVSSY